MQSDSNLRLALHSRHFTLIPSDYYDASAGRSYLTQLGMNADTDFAVNAIPEWKAHLLFSLEGFPRQAERPQHIWSIWRGLLFAAHQLGQLDPEPSLFMHVTPGQIYLVAFEGDQLQFFNTFPVRDIHDHLYFLLHGLEQWGKSPVHTPVHISGHLTEDSPLYKLLEGYVGELSIIQKDIYANSSSADSYFSPQFFDLCSFVACVSSVEN